jgi:hypothetical protein
MVPPPLAIVASFVGGWRQAGVWDRIMDALAAGHDAVVQMIDTSVVRVYHTEPVSRGNREEHMPT